MPTPREVFDNPKQFLKYLQSGNFEGQFFDRKEVRDDCNTQRDNIKKKIIKTISGFANSNRDGGLLVLGIADDGTIIGWNHVQEENRNGILQAKEGGLKGHSTQTKEFQCQNVQGEDDKIYLLYTPWTSNAICETTDAFPKAWKRDGPQCLPLTEQDREQLKRDKGIVDFELSYCCPYDADELDTGVVEEFKKAFLETRDSQYDYTTEEVLFQAGALIKENGKYAFTNAGYLFFVSNPRKRFGGAFVRMLRYDVSIEELSDRGKTTLDKDFDGALPNIIRNLRTFLKDSALFRAFSKRSPSGGFIDESEYPFIAIDEALVNAITHRDYGVTTPTHCIAYRDRLVVKNPGNIPQQVPDSFSLHERRLDSVPRNQKIADWMRLLKFVRALSEGTRRMREEMEKMKLPAPHYQTDSSTSVTLENKIDERLEKYALEVVGETKEYTNLFPLEQSNQRMSRGEFSERRGNILTAIKDALLGQGWYIDYFSFGRIVAHERHNSLPLSPEIEKTARIYAAYEFQVRQYAETLYLCVDYRIEVKNVARVNELLRYINPDQLIEKRAVANYSGEWERGTILGIDLETTKVALSDLDAEVDLPNNEVIPSLGQAAIKEILKSRNVSHNLDQKIKEYALTSQRNAAKSRAEKTLKIARYLANKVFPIKVGNLTFSLVKTPAHLKSVASDSPSQEIQPLSAFHEFGEPTVKFYKGNEEATILDGLVKYSSYEVEPRDIELIPICTPDLRGEMQELITRIQRGKYKYRGTERTFRSKLTYQSVVTAPFEEYETECHRLLDEHPSWEGNKELSPLFLVYVPEELFPITDLDSPYYAIKEFLLSKGVPVQMVNTPTLKNPDWKDLNLALNITAKCGVVPWVLPDALPDADFFVGLSYTQHRDREIPRCMAFANVFNKYGHWMFYQGNTETFSYDERHAYFKKLVRSTLKKLDLRESSSIHFHYSAKFSTEDRRTIVEAARSVRPKGKYTFVWINSSHGVRFYDPSPQTDGSLPRGTYVVGSPNQFYLSTTGYNTYQRALGTPRALEVNVWTKPFDASNPPNLKVIAKQLIYLTKLNWASTRSFCGTPITIKYARDIARFASAFTERSGKFELHRVLEDTPWFI